jgi:hypothetical protein
MVWLMVEVEIGLVFTCPVPSELGIQFVFCVSIVRENSDTLFFTSHCSSSSRMGMNENDILQ